MNTKAILSALTIFFAFVVAVGLLSPKEAEILLDDVVTVLEEEEVDEEVRPAEPAAPTPVTSEHTLHKVKRVIDGDTIVILSDSKDFTVRLIGVDTPESVHPSKPVQCFGLEASEKTKEWLTGRSVWLEQDATQDTKDKYGRTLAYVYRDDGLFVNLELLRAGYAYEYTYIIPYKYQREFKEAELEARNTDAGLWSQNACQ